MTGISSLPPQHLLPLPGFLTSMRKTVPKQLHDQGVLSLQDSSFGVSNSAIASSNAFFARLQAFSGEFRISQQKTEKFSARPSQIGHVGCISFLLISNASWQACWEFDTVAVTKIKKIKGWVFQRLHHSWIHYQLFQQTGLGAYVLSNEGWEVS